MQDWMATRDKIRAAKGDKVKIAEAMTEYIGTSDPGRKETVDNLVHSLSTGRRADWPAALAAERPKFDAVTGRGVIPEITALATSKGLDAALVRIAEYQGQIRDLQQVIKDKASEFRSEGIRMEMNRTLANRAGELAYLKNDLPKRMRAGQQQAHDQHVEDRLKHGVDVENGQSFQPLFDPEECISEEDLYAPPPAAPAPVDPAAQAAQDRADALEAIKAKTSVTRSNQKGERAVFTWCMNEWNGKKGNWLDKPDLGAIAKKLASVKEGYDEWDATVREIEKMAKAAGIELTSLDYRLPNRDQWNDINATIFNKG
jgi:hypothetical protein